MSDSYFVSVIIPTYKDLDRLKICVDALKNQSYSRDLFEVLIINNDPDKEILGITTPKNFKIINEKKIGSYAARNTGIKNAVGEILAFTDSDCIPDQDWIKNSVKLMANGAQRIAGHIELFYKSDVLTQSENYEKVYAFDQREYASMGRSVTANMITWKNFFYEIGFFDDSLFSGGDMEWSIRASNNQIPILYANEVIVKHPARSNLSELVKKAKRVSLGNVKDQSIYRIVLKGFIPSPKSLIKAFRCHEISFSSRAFVLAIYFYLKLVKMAAQISAKLSHENS